MRFLPFLCFNSCAAIFTLSDHLDINNSYLIANSNQQKCQKKFMQQVLESNRRNTSDFQGWVVNFLLLGEQLQICQSSNEQSLCSIVVSLKFIHPRQFLMSSFLAKSSIYLYPTGVYPNARWTLRWQDQQNLMVVLFALLALDWGSSYSYKNVAGIIIAYTN